MSVPSWDLDAPPESGPADGRGRSGLVLLLAVALAGLALGGLAGSLRAPDPAASSPPAATVTARETYLDLPASTDPTGPTGPTGVPVMVLRLQVDNPAATAIRLTRLTLDGVGRERTVLALDVPVAAGASAAVDVSVRPDCSPRRAPALLRARLTVAGSDIKDLTGIAVAPSGPLSRAGGVCSLLETGLPRGWRTLLVADSARQEGADLVITVPDLSGAGLDGSVIDNRLLPTVFVSDHLIRSSAQVLPGEQTRLTLNGPPTCIAFTRTVPIPSTLRLLAQGEGGMQQRLVVVGPELTRWLRLDCDLIPDRPGSRASSSPNRTPAASRDSR